LPLVRKGAIQSFGLRIRPDTTLYQRCRAYETVGRPLAPPPLRRISYGVDRTLRCSPRRRSFILFRPLVLVECGLTPFTVNARKYSFIDTFYLPFLLRLCQKICIYSAMSVYLSSLDRRLPFP
jgi:hypothetical protein